MEAIRVLVSRDERNYKFYILALFISILILFSKIWSDASRGILFIAAIALALYVSNSFVTITSDNITNFNTQTYVQLQALQAKVNAHIEYKIKLSSISGQQLPKEDRQKLIERNRLDSIYIDSTMINFLHSILPLYEYNQDEFYMLVKGTNNILKIRKQIEDFYIANSNMTPDPQEPKGVSFKEPKIIKTDGVYTQNLSAMFSIAIDLKSNCINNLHNMIYKVPKTNKFYSYIDNVIERYTILINRNLKVISDYQLHSIKETGINTNTKFVYYKGTKPFDASRDQNIVLSKNLDQRNQLTNLYV